MSDYDPEQGKAMIEALGLTARTNNAPLPEDQPTGQAATPGPDTSPLSERERVAKLVLSDPKLAQFVKGETVDEMVESANSFRATIQKVREEQTPPPSFDGGVRTPAPSSSPEQDHNNLLLEALGIQPSRVP